jgi:hypothetical protein
MFLRYLVSTMSAAPGIQRDHGGCRCRRLVSDSGAEIDHCGIAAIAEEVRTVVGDEIHRESENGRRDAMEGEREGGRTLINFRGQSCVVYTHKPFVELLSRCS